MKKRVRNRLLKMSAYLLAPLLCVAGCAQTSSEVQSEGLAADGSAVKYGSRGDVAFYKVSTFAQKYKEITGFAGVTSIEIGIGGGLQSSTKDVDIYFMDASGKSVFSCSGTTDSEEMDCEGQHAITEPVNESIEKLLKQISSLPGEGISGLSCVAFWDDGKFCAEYGLEQACDNLDNYPKSTKKQCMAFGGEQYYNAMDSALSEMFGYSTPSFTFTHKPAAPAPEQPAATPAE